jgi:hypothetical protein
MNRKRRIEEDEDEDEEYEELNDDELDESNTTKRGSFFKVNEMHCIDHMVVFDFFHLSSSRKIANKISCKIT